MQFVHSLVTHLAHFKQHCAPDTSGPCACGAALDEEQYCSYLASTLRMLVDLTSQVRDIAPMCPVGSLLLLAGICSGGDGGGGSTGVERHWPLRGMVFDLFQGRILLAAVAVRRVPLDPAATPPSVHRAHDAARTQYANVPVD